MTKYEIILDFIKQFRDLGAENCFSNGMCYYFTEILTIRFGPISCLTVYDEVMNHFATKIDGRVFDITGDITDNPKYNWKPWLSILLSDKSHSSRILRDCILKAPCKLCGLCNDAQRSSIGEVFCQRTKEIIDIDGGCLYE